MLPRVVLFALCLAGMTWLLHQPGATAPAMAGALHAMIYAGLFCVFALSLRPGRLPVLTRLMLRVHPTASPARRGYSRGATLAWALFFLAQILVSGLMLAWAGPSLWRWYVTALNVPLVLAMFVGEFAVRWLYFRGREPISVRDTLSALAARRRG